MPRIRTPVVLAAEASGIAEYRVGVKDLPLSVRPRERLEQHGPSALSDVELLAIILGTGTRTATRKVDVLEMSSNVLVHRGGLGGVGRAALKELCQEPGLGRAKAIGIKAALELGRRLVSLDPGQRVQIGSPLDVWNLVHADMASFEQEHLRILLLNTKNHVIAAHDLYRGSLNSTTVRVAELFRDAIRESAAGLILVHNHPSGDPTPSNEDVQLTREAVDAGKLLDVAVLDHIVIGRGDRRFVSLKERGLGFPAVVG